MLSLLKTYESKLIVRQDACGDAAYRHGAYQQIHRQDDVIAQQAEKTKEQAATAKEVTELEVSASRDSHVKRDLIIACKH